jgi:glyoxylase-like metal-dependent hydrolase (beta-lactamase superfamily II)
MRNAPEILSFPVGLLDVNCYLIYPKQDGILYIIDPGGNAEKILKQAEGFHASGYQVMLTHAHVDHISALGELRKALGFEKVYLHPDDLPLYKSPANALLPIMPAASGLPETAWPPPENGDFKVIETPGHTFGGVCYYFPELQGVFTGDTLFAGSVGRTDLPGSGEHEDLIGSIRLNLFPLPDTTRVFPGHGEESTIKMEKQFNQFLR